jgi:hypothetical protein
MLVKEQGGFGQIAFGFVLIAHDVLVSLPRSPKVVDLVRLLKPADPILTFEIS